MTNGVHNNNNPTVNQADFQEQKSRVPESVKKVAKVAGLALLAYASFNLAMMSFMTGNPLLGIGFIIISTVSLFKLFDELKLDKIGQI